MPLLYIAFQISVAYDFIRASWTPCLFLHSICWDTIHKVISGTLRSETVLKADSHLRTIDLTLCLIDSGKVDVLNN